MQWDGYPPKWKKKETLKKNIQTFQKKE
jgi:hypothetical protein